MKSRILILTFCTVVLLMEGCVSQKAIPAIEIYPATPRHAYQVLDTVVETSTTDIILLGLIQVVDGKYLRLLGIPFYKEQYSFSSGYFGLTAARAYYKALNATPDADAVFYKSMDSEHSGFPLLVSTEKVTFRGKAIKLKTDQELYSSANAMGLYMSEPGDQNVPGRTIIGYHVDTSRKGPNGGFLRVPIYEDEQKK